MDNPLLYKLCKASFVLLGIFIVELCLKLFKFFVRWSTFFCSTPKYFYGENIICIKNEFLNLLGCVLSDKWKYADKAVFYITLK